MAVQEPSDALGCVGVVTESPCDALATQETPTVKDGMVTESPCDAVATQQTPDVIDVVVIESPSDAVAIQETPNVVDVVVTKSPCDSVATKKTAHIVADAVATQEMYNTVDSVTSESPSDGVATQETCTFVDSVVSESPSDAVATQETPNVVNDAVATQETAIVVNSVVSESPCDVVCEGSEIIASTCDVSVVLQPLMGVQAFSEENINLPVESCSSMFVYELAESFTEDGATNINASELSAPIHDVSAASTGGESAAGNITLSIEIDFSLNTQVIGSLFYKGC